MSKKPAQRRSPQDSSLRNGLWFVCFSGLMIAIMQHGYIFFLAGMLPTIVARMVDRTKRKYYFSIVMGFNLAGVVPFMADLWRSDNSAAAVESMFADPYVWLVMYGMAAIGWVLIFTSPEAAMKVVRVLNQGKVQALEKEQRELLEEWGPELRRNDTE